MTIQKRLPTLATSASSALVYLMLKSNPNESNSIQKYRVTDGGKVPISQ